MCNFAIILALSVMTTPAEDSLSALESAEVLISTVQSVRGGRFLESYSAAHGLSLTFKQTPLDTAPVFDGSRNALYYLYEESGKSGLYRHDLERRTLLVSTEKGCVNKSLKIDHEHRHLYWVETHTLKNSRYNCIKRYDLVQESNSTLPTPRLYGISDIELEPETESILVSAMSGFGITRIANDGTSGSHLISRDRSVGAIALDSRSRTIYYIAQGAIKSTSSIRNTAPKIVLSRPLIDWNSQLEYLPRSNQLIWNEDGAVYTLALATNKITRVSSKDEYIRAPYLCRTVDANTDNSPVREFHLNPALMTLLTYVLGVFSLCLLTKRIAQYTGVRSKHFRRTRLAAFVGFTIGLFGLSSLWCFEPYLGFGSFRAFISDGILNLYYNSRPLPFGFGIGHTFSAVSWVPPDEFWTARI